MRGELPPFAQPAWLTAAIRQTVHRTRGLAKVIAAALDCSENHVTDLADPTRRVPMKVYEIEEFVRATGDYEVLDQIEARVGRVAFPVLAANPSGDALQQALAKEVTAFGEFLKETANDLADDTLSQEEMKRLLPAIDRMIARTCEYRELIVKKAASDAMGAEALRA
jgi:hypothetical protein